MSHERKTSPTWETEWNEAWSEAFPGLNRDQILTVLGKKQPTPKPIGQIVRDRVRRGMFAERPPGRGIMEGGKPRP